MAHEQLYDHKTLFNRGNMQQIQALLLVTIIPSMILYLLGSSLLLYLQFNE